MKKLLIVLAVVSLLVAPAFAAKKSNSFEKAVKGEGVDWATQQNVITVNPLVFLGILSAHYEMAMGKTNGLGFNGLFSFWGTDKWNYMTVGVGAEYNWYFQNHALNGWFAGPHAQVTMASVNYEYTAWNDTYTEIITKKESGTGVFFGIGGHGGYRWIWDNGFTLDLQLGVTYSIGSNITLGGATASVGGAGFGPGLNLGYAW